MMLGYQSAAAAAAAAGGGFLNKSVGFFGGLVGGENGHVAYTYWLCGVQLTAAQLLFAVLGLQAVGMGAMVGGGGGGLTDIGFWVSGAGAGLGAAAHQFMK